MQTPNKFDLWILQVDAETIITYTDAVTAFSSMDALDVWHFCE